MIQHIKVHEVLQQSVAGFYADLVTRPTGRAVRESIERALPAGTIAVMDFTGVGCLDYSCADEIVAKLMLRYCGQREGDDRAGDGYFLFRGLGEHHLDALEIGLRARERREAGIERIAE